MDFVFRQVRQIDGAPGLAGGAVDYITTARMIISGKLLKNREGRADDQVVAREADVSEDRRSIILLNPRSSKTLYLPV